MHRLLIATVAVPMIICGAVSCTRVELSAPQLAVKGAHLTYDKWRKLISYPLYSTNGQKVTLGDIISNKERLLVHVGATWCAACEKEIPLFEDLVVKARRVAPVTGFVVVSLDRNERDVQRWAQRLKLSTPVLMDPNMKILSLIGDLALPTTILLDKKEIKAVFEGAHDWSKLDPREIR